MTSPVRERTFRCCVFLLMTACVDSLRGQALPAASGSKTPHVDGSLRYEVSLSERQTLGNNSLGVGGSSTNVSGDVAYMSNSKQRPFALIYAGGYLASTSGYPSSAFHSLSMSQGLILHSWSVSLADSVSYLPQTPSSGLSGIPGVGDLGVAGVDPVSTTGQGILTNSSSRVSNTASASAQRNLTGKTSFGGSGTWGIQRFLSSGASAGLDSSQESGGGNLSHRIDALSSISGNYGWSRFSYGTQATSLSSLPISSFTSQQATFGYTRRWTRKVTTDGSIGPQWTGGGSVPTSINVSGGVSINYTGKATALSASYSRGANAGSGVVAGAHNDGLQASASRGIGQAWRGAATAGYSRTTSLQQALGASSFSGNSVLLGTQVNRGLGRNLSLYFSYNLQRQTIEGASAALNTFSGVTHVLGFGLTYSPAMMRLGQH